MEATIEQGMTRDEKRVVGFTFLAHALNHSLEVVYGAVLVVVALEFGVGLALLGGIANMASLAYAFSALPAGAMADRMGSRRMLVVSLAGSAVTAILAAVAPTVTVLALALVLTGLLGGMYHPAGLSFITRGVRQRARGLGFHGMGGNLGTALAPLAAAAIAGAWSWRASFGVFAGLSAVVAVLMLVSPIVEARPGTRVAASAGASPRAMRERPWVTPLVMVFVLNAFYGFIYRGTVTFLPLHLSQHLGFQLFGFEPVVIGGSFATVALLFGVAGQYVGGEMGHRIRREVVILPLAALAVVALVLVGSTEGGALLASAAAFAFFHFMVQPSANTLIAEYATARMQGVAFGFTFLAGFGFGSFAGTLGGVVAERYGTPWVFIMLATSAFLVFSVAATLYVYVRLMGPKPLSA